MQESLQINRERAAGEIAIGPNPMDRQPGVTAVPSFSELMNHKVNEISGDQNRADAMRTAVDLGRSDDLVGAMVASQKASLSFSALMQVRNKLVTAFDDVMKMPL
ncbi:flagellar hook-basal body complex protein FliE [Ferrimonas balearica]|nr:flagellar hook-basal body complex protein FliE [Ferrimonas balearica]MBY6017004.1 flagellar hook-basal body complex protein FliE [Halomonas denitrificans]MBW3162983.1 flagellar hook-basal body complex protein FliE [Ferrimonas balearica]MBY5980675.1 flagellar hook-basal body complex protein FliE [Ferrimonas balearica]MBY6093279.1 flagellar hook-basal body complex protein FliE [Ferrimonas balearica]